MSKVVEVTALPLTFGVYRTQTNLLGEDAGYNMAYFMEHSCLRS
jgi:hypothetical protein